MKTEVTKMNHHYYDKKHLGYSDVAALTVVGFVRNESESIRAHILHFGGDGVYHAYIVNHNCIIPDSYTLECSYDSWIRIYDDDECTFRGHADHINIYRRGGYGCIIELLWDGNPRIRIGC